MPRISVGTDAFKSTLVSPLVGWVHTGVYDAKEGLEIAVLTDRKIAFLDPKTYVAKRTVRIDDVRAANKQPVSLRADGTLHLMAGGGGFSDVGLFELDGHCLWRFKAGLVSPNKMIAADLDDDGVKEFYVADEEGVFRLDADGQIVWRSVLKANMYLFTLPTEGERPAAVVTNRGMWDCNGKILQDSIKSPAGTYRLQPIKWGHAYCLASVKTSEQGDDVFVFDPSGKTVFKQSIDGWSVNDILSVRFKPEEAPHLVIVGGHGPGTKLMQLSIFSHNGTLVYQELRKPETLKVIPGDAAAVDKLLLCTGGIKTLEKP